MSPLRNHDADTAPDAWPHLELPRHTISAVLSAEWPAVEALLKSLTDPPATDAGPLVFPKPFELSPRTVQRAFERAVAAGLIAPHEAPDLPHQSALHELLIRHRTTPLSLHQATICLSLDALLRSAEAREGAGELAILRYQHSVTAGAEPIGPFDLLYSRLRSRSVDPLSLQAEIVRGLDEFAMAHAQAALGFPSDLPITAAWSVLAGGFDGSAGAHENKRDLPDNSTPRAVFHLIDAPLTTLPYSHAIDALLKRCTLSGESVERALVRAAGHVFSSGHTPPADPRLLSVALTTALVELLRHSEGTSQSGPAADTNTAPHHSLRAIIPEIENPDARFFEASEVLGEALSRRGAGKDSFERVSEAIERLGRRPYCYEELGGAAALAEQFLAELSQNGAGPSVPSVSHGTAAQSTRGASLARYLRAFTASYINRNDLRRMGLEDDVRSDLVIQKILHAQLLGFITTRAGAITYACQLAAARGWHAKFEVGLLAHSGADVRQFVHTTPVADDVTATCRVRRYQAISRQQFSSAELSEARVHRELFDSGNYPNLVNELRRSTINSATVYEWLREGRLLNLVELDSLCASFAWQRATFTGFKGDLAAAEQLLASSATYARVERFFDKELAEIALCLGYHGGSHIGQGLRHLIEQRARDGSIHHLSRPGESPTQAVERFIHDAVLHVAGNGSVKIPSGLYPETHLILSGEVAGTSGNFLSLVLSNNLAPGASTSSRRMEVVTAIYHSHAAQLRSFLVKQLKGWVARQSLPNDQIAEAATHFIASATPLLLRSRLNAISLDEIGWRPPEPYAGVFQSRQDPDTHSLVASADAEILEGLFADEERGSNNFRGERRFLRAQSTGHPPRATSFSKSASLPSSQPPPEFPLGVEGWYFNPTLAQVLSSEDSPGAT